MDTEYLKIYQRQDSRANLGTVIRDKFLCFDTDNNHLLYSKDGTSFFDFYNSREMDSKLSSITWTNILSKPTTLSGLGIPSSDPLFDSTYLKIGINSDSIIEGAVNLYYTDGRVKAFGDANYLPISGIDASKVTSGTFDLARIPVLPSMLQIVSSGDLTALTTAQQAQIGQGTVVTTIDGSRLVYTGSGSKTAAASYVLLADITPDWSVISNRPINVSTWTNDAGYLTSSSSLAWGKLTGVPTTLSGFGITASDSLLSKYLTGNQTITLSGVVTGSGTTTIATSIADGALSISKTSGLQAALNSYLPLTGGTMTVGAKILTNKDMTISTSSNPNYVNAPFVAQRYTSDSTTTTHASIGFHNVGVNAAALFYHAGYSNFWFNDHIGGLYQLWSSKDFAITYLSSINQALTTASSPTFATITLSGAGALALTANGSGPYMRSVLYQDTSGVYLERGLASESGSASPLPFYISKRGGGTPYPFIINANDVTTNTMLYANGGITAGNAGMNTFDSSYSWTGLNGYNNRTTWSGFMQSSGETLVGALAGGLVSLAVAQTRLVTLDSTSFTVAPQLIANGGAQINGTLGVSGVAKVGYLDIWESGSPAAYFRLAVSGGYLYVGDSVSIGMIPTTLYSVQCGGVYTNGGTINAGVVKASGLITANGGLQVKGSINIPSQEYATSNILPVVAAGEVKVIYSTGHGTTNYFVANSSQGVTYRNSNGVKSYIAAGGIVSLDLYGSAAILVGASSSQAELIL